MNPPLPTSLPIAETLWFLLVLTAFWWPAWRLHQAWSDAEETTESKLTLSFVTAFGVFSATTGPLLLLHASTTTALFVVATVWLLFLSLAEFLARRRGRLASLSPPTASTDHAPANQSLSFGGRPTWILMALTAVSAIVYARDILPRRYGLLALIGCFGLNALLALRQWRLGFTGVTPEAASTPTVPAPPSLDRRLLQLLGISLFAACLITPFFHLRADADDNLYLSEALLLQDSEAMGATAPTHRGENLPSNPMYGWQSFELWSAMLARLSGLHPLIVMRTLFAPLLLLLTLGVYRSLFRRILPAHLLPLATVLVLGYFLFGMSSQWTPNNYLLPRPQQGKTWLMHLGIAATVLHALRFLERPRLGNWFLLLATSFACLGWAPTSIVLLPVLIATLGLAFLLQKRDFASLRPILQLGVCALPPLLFGLYLFAQQDALRLEVTLDWAENSPWTGLFFYQFLQGHSQGGGLELFLLTATPLLCLGMQTAQRLAYPVLFFLALGLVALNPLLFGVVHDYVGDTGYLRFFWLLPLPVLLGFLGVRLSASMSKKGVPMSLGAVLCLAAFPLFGTHYVWGTANLYDAPEEGIYLAETSNPMKVPDGLLEVAESLRSLPLGPENRILCHLNEVMHLAPLIKEFDFVYARNYQTLAPLLVLGRDQEAVRREALGTAFLRGEMASTHAQGLLEQEKAQYIIVGPWSPAVIPQLLELGYRERLASDGYALWVKFDANAPIGNTSNDSE